MLRRIFIFNIVINFIGRCGNNLNIAIVVFLNFLFDKGNALFLRSTAPVAYSVKNIRIVKVVFFIFLKLIKDKIPITQFFKRIVIIVRIDRSVNFAAVNTLPLADIKRNTVSTAPSKLLSSKAD